MIKSIRKFFATAFGKQAGDGKIFHPSQTCPECGSTLWTEAGGAEQIWTCPNPDCPAQVRRGLVHWCSPEAMDIEGGEDFVSQLVESGLVRDVADLYSLKLAAVVELEGMGKETAKDFLDAVAASKTREAWRILYGMGIMHIEAGVVKSLCRHFATLDDVFAASAKRLMEADDIGEVIAQSIVHWHGDPVNRRLVERLRRAGLNFKLFTFQPEEHGSRPVISDRNIDR